MKSSDTISLDPVEPVFADSQMAEQVIRRQFPEVRDVRFVDHGQDNLVALVDGLYAFKFPRTLNAWERDRFEAAMLRQLEGKCPIPIPIVLSQGDRPAYIATSFVHGTHLSERDVADLSAEKIQQIGADLAAFMYTLHQSASVTEVSALRSTFRLDELDDPWDPYFEKTLLQDKLPVPEQDAIAKEYYAKWLALPKTPAFVVHDDLHSDNLLFEGGHLSGVLDFGGVYIGTAEQEMRQLYRLGDDLLVACAAAYQRLSGQPVSIEAARIWSIVTELGAYSERWQAGQTNHASFLRAQGHLQKWLPAVDWSVPPLKAIVFDCFGVLAGDAWLPFKRRYFGQDHDLFDEATKLSRLVDSGGQTYDHFITEVARLAGMEPAQAQAEIETNPANEPLFDYIRRNLKAHYAIGILSNASSNWLPDLFSPEQLALFDATVLSYQIQHIKPDRAAYLAIADKLRVTPGECLFVDDQEKYCGGARATGMRTIRYHNFDQFCRDIAPYVEEVT